MAVYKLFPTQDATLYSLYPTMNTGLDAILEVSNQIGINGTPDVARYLIQFDTSEIQDVIDNKIVLGFNITEDQKEILEYIDLYNFNGFVLHLKLLRIL
jgi:hypothetical protein